MQVAKKQVLPIFVLQIHKSKRPQLSSSGMLHIESHYMMQLPLFPKNGDLKLYEVHTSVAAYLCFYYILPPSFSRAFQFVVVIFEEEKKFSEMHPK